MAYLVCITGTDGAGKTCITDWLQVYLQQHGRDTATVWSRFNNYLSKPILAITRLTGHNHFKPVGDEVHGFHDFQTLGIWRYVFAFLQAIDVNVATYIKILKPRKDCDVLICERGPWDTLTDVIVDTRLTQLKNHWIGKLIVRQVSHKSITFLISRDIEKICETRTELNDDYKLKEKYATYHELQKQYGWILIDNNASLDGTKQQIVDQLKKLGVIP